MGITDSLKGLLEEEQSLEPRPQSNWVKELLDKRYQPQAQRIKRKPIGFQFERDPFDPSSYYKDIGTLRGLSRAATEQTQIEVANKENSEAQKAWEESQNALKGVNPNFTGGEAEESWNAGGNNKYRLGPVSGNTAKAANYFGNKYGIKTIGGYRDHGSVPGSDHPKGRGLDYMINNIPGGKKRGDALANDMIKNYKAWNVKYIIWNRYIWHPGRGWRKYNGPSPHTDHVHASFNK